MDFKSVSVNNCYILGDEVFNTLFFTYIHAKAIYSASIFHLAFFKGDINSIHEDVIRAYEKFSMSLYQFNSPYLNIPFEINFHEKKMYQSYYESDHFPLSLWIEEKSLIPFNILIKIMEDTLKGLEALEKTGHSHLFLTPEEILIPLQWTNDNYVKIYNIGINSLAHALLNDKEIVEYRKNYKLNNGKTVEKDLIKDISEDLYSYGKIMSVIVSLCDFGSNDYKTVLLEKLNLLITKPKSFTCINDAITLFDDFFIEKNKRFELPDKLSDYTYAGQASFNIPEYNDWQEEAVLEPLNDNKELQDENRSRTRSKGGGDFYKLILAFFSKLFSGKKGSQ